MFAGDDSRREFVSFSTAQTVEAGMKRMIGAALLVLCALLPAAARADQNICPRPVGGSDVQPPPDLYSQNGKLDIVLGYYTAMDAAGRTLFCFVTNNGLESPTLHVNPGDTIHIRLT